MLRRPGAVYCFCFQPVLGYILFNKWKSRYYCSFPSVMIPFITSQFTPLADANASARDSWLRWDAHSNSCCPLKKAALKKKNRVSVRCPPPSSSPIINNSLTWTFELIMGHRWPIWCRSCQKKAARTFKSEGWSDSTGGCSH